MPRGITSGLSKSHMLYVMIGPVTVSTEIWNLDVHAEDGIGLV